MKIINNNHLMYCLNIHHGEHWDENLDAIKKYALAVKNKICPDKPFAAGLRLSAVSASELLKNINSFKKFLLKNNLYVVSINGFPYGSFHGKRIKESVYLPDWSSRERVKYTINLIKILAAILPEGETGSISTLPLHYGKEYKPESIANILYISSYLKKLEQKTGRHIVLALEPEPDCYLDTLDSTLNFFNRLFSTNKFSSRYIGICLDTCHAIVGFESPLKWLRTLNQKNILVPKIQISSALKATVNNNAQPLLASFNEQTYLHQTRVMQNKNLYSFKDLPDALEKELNGEWRIHFHVPLVWRGKKISSTSSKIETKFFKYALKKENVHLEIETYSFNVLPGRKPSVINSITDELNWVIKKLKNNKILLYKFFQYFFFYIFTAASYFIR